MKGDTFGNLRVEDTEVEESNTNQNDGCEIFVKEEMPDEASFEPLIEKPVHKTSSQTHKKRKRTDRNDYASEWMNKNSPVNKSDQDAEQHFLLSLLPDLKNLSSRRKRAFKMQTMSLLHQLLEEDEQEKEESSLSVASSASV